MKKSLCTLAACLILGGSIDAQVKLGTNPSVINANSLLEMESANKGFVAPRVALTSVNSPSPLAAGLLTGTIVFNTAAAGTGNNAVYANHYYFWNGAAWAQIADQDASVAVLTPVLDNTVTTPPTIHADGDSYIVPSGATGVWAGNVNKIATWDAGSSSWIYYTPVANDQTTVTTGTNAGKTYRYDGTTWNQVTTPVPVYWQPGGNSGLTPSNNTLGTTAFLPLRFITKGVERMVIDTLYNVRIGQGNITSGQFSGAWGYRDSATGTGNGAWAIGYASSAIGDRAIALGQGTRASGAFSLATGINTKASGYAATAQGSGTFASGTASTAMGQNTVATGTSSGAWGSSDSATGAGFGAWAIGNSCKALGDRSVALGSNTLANNSYSMAMGVNSTASGYSSTASGNGTTASGDHSFAAGIYSTAAGTAGVAMGWGASASGSQGIALGNNVFASGTYSSAIGYASAAAGNSSGTWGILDTATGTGYGAWAIGYSNKALGDRSVALGYNIRMSHAGAVGLGDISAATLISGADNQMSARFAGGYQFYSNAGATIGAALAPGATSWTSVSDRRSKEHIQGLNYGLNAVMKLQPVSYRYKGSENTSIGFIAQEVKEVVPEVVDQTKMGPDHDYLGVRYSELVPVLAKAIQEQQQMIGEQQKTIADLTKRIKELETKK